MVQQRLIPVVRQQGGLFPQPLLKFPEACLVERALEGVRHQLLVVAIHGRGIPCSWKRRSMHFRRVPRRLKRVALRVPALRLIAFA